MKRNPAFRRSANQKNRRILCLNPLSKGPLGLKSTSLLGTVQTSCCCSPQLWLGVPSSESSRSESSEVRALELERRGKCIQDLFKWSLDAPKKEEDGGAADDSGITGIQGSFLL